MSPSRFQEWTTGLQEWTKKIWWQIKAWNCLTTSRFQEWTTGLQECRKEVWWRLQECHTAFQVPYLSRCDLVIIIASHHRSGIGGSADNFHTFILIGKPTKGNDANNVTFSPKVERAIRRRKKGNRVNITGDDGKTHAEWIVGDSGAGCSVIANAALLIDIRRAPNNNCMTIHCNSWVITVDQMGTLNGFGRVWYNQMGSRTLCRSVK